MTRLLRYPHPYRAALAIASDIDSCPADRFVKIHRHLDDIGVPVGDSFFFYASPDQLNWQDHRDAVLDGLRRGWIDTIHGYGDFNERGGFTREMAQRALAELRGAGFRLEIFSNHGNPRNAQNLCHTGGRGDVKDAEEYHADLLVRHGVRFVWPTWLTHLVGQDRDADAWEWARHYPGASAARRIGAGLLSAMGFIGMIEPYPGNDLVRLHTMRDGQKVYAFRRYGVWRRDDAPALRELISRDRIERLIERRGASIVYTHLGRNWEPIPELAELTKHPELWLTTPGRLLRYVAMRDGIRWKAKDGVVTIEPLDDPVLGPIEELTGLTFDGASVVVYGGRELQTAKPASNVVRVGG